MLGSAQSETAAPRLAEWSPTGQMVVHLPSLNMHRVTDVFWTGGIAHYLLFFPSPFPSQILQQADTLQKMRKDFSNCGTHRAQVLGTASSKDNAVTAHAKDKTLWAHHMVK